MSRSLHLTFDLLLDFLLQLFILLVLLLLALLALLGDTTVHLAKDLRLLLVAQRLQVRRGQIVLVEGHYRSHFLKNQE